MKSIRPLLFILFIFTIHLAGCGVIVRGVGNGITAANNSFIFHQGRHGDLTEKEMLWAKTAWQYFENNINPSTGLPNSVDMYPALTMWHLGDYLAALVGARELNLIDVKAFDLHLSQVLYFLNTMDLAFGKLPNKVYSTNNGKMVDYANQPQEIGWSALDIGRLLIWLKILKCRYPVYAEYIDKAVLRWDFCMVVDNCGSLYGAVKVHDKIQTYQEGRLGYEEYAAKGFQLWGFDTTKASKITPYEIIRIHGIDIYYDGRDPRHTGTYSPVLSMGSLLDGMEFNWDLASDTEGMDSIHTDAVMAKIAESIYKVQEARYKKEKVFTARTDHQVAGPPFFVYDAIFAGGYPWNVISDDGRFHKNQALVSTRAAFGMWTLWKTDYTTDLMTLIQELYHTEKGWYEGRMENTGNHMKLVGSGTNAVVLEALLYKSQGKLYAYSEEQDKGYYHEYILNPFGDRGRCFPRERDRCPGGS